jgi:hypothetical protein
MRFFILLFTLFSLGASVVLAQSEKPKLVDYTNKTGYYSFEFGGTMYYIDRGTKQQIETNAFNLNSYFDVQWIDENKYNLIFTSADYESQLAAGDTINLQIYFSDSNKYKASVYIKHFFESNGELLDIELVRINEIPKQYKGFYLQAPKDWQIMQQTLRQKVHRYTIQPMVQVKNDSVRITSEVWLATEAHINRISERVAELNSDKNRYSKIDTSTLVVNNLEGVLLQFSELQDGKKLQQKMEYYIMANGFIYFVSLETYEKNLSKHKQTFIDIIQSLKLK